MFYTRMLHKCAIHPNSFCYVCGELAFISQWQNFTTTDFFGNFKAENYESLVEEFLIAYKVMDPKCH
jgi:hypothetical protein